MENVSNQNVNGNSEGTSSNVELSLFGIDKKWVRSDGSWVDKSKLREEKQHSVRDLNLVQSDGGAGHWWQFWKA